MLCLVVLPVKHANACSTHYNNQVSNQLPDLKNKNLLTLYWRLFSELRREYVAVSFPCQGSLYIMNECQEPITTQINHYAQRNIVDGLLILIFRMGQGVCRFLFLL